MVKNLRIDEFDYPLPDERIARYPLAERDQCKLLLRKADGTLSDHIFTDLPQLLPEDAMLIYNNTRVINARLRFRKPGGATIEIFCLEPVTPRDYAVSFAQTSGCSWTCFVGNSKRWKQGALDMPLTVAGQHITFRAERLSKEGNSSTINFSWDNPAVTFSEIIAAVGEIPIPPYLNRSTENSDLTD
ncbi:MAG: S-adenosylmethionine:tRNA ribosyltransferase-isomerase, partial [Muribaculaceae bacterium]|nr:S-adenosylmethionine:tRNA ribosyltransferase-isomerase [Muribaculaceae bacterium]